MTNGRGRVSRDVVVISRFTREATTLEDLSEHLDGVWRFEARGESVVRDSSLQLKNSERELVKDVVVVAVSEERQLVLHIGLTPSVDQGEKQ